MKNTAAYAPLLLCLFIGTISAEPKFLRDADTVSSGLFVRKAVQENITSVQVCQDDDELYFPVEANGVYVWTANIRITCDLLRDARWQWTGPASPTTVRIRQIDDAQPSMTGHGTVGMWTAFNNEVTPTTMQVATTIRIEGFLENGVNAGVVRFQCAQTSSGVQTTSFLEGNRIEWKKLN